MKKIFYILMGAALSLTVISCGSNDDFTETIFDTETPAVDQNAATAPFDQWLYDNFVVPYNVEIQYKFNFPASNLDYQLTPAEYKKSQLLSYFIRYLFYDVYTLYGGEDFMKKYGPRIFHFIGSNAYSPTTGTEMLGYASAGVKITLINVNNLKLWTEDNPYTSADMELLNKDQFHTMHHEFSHILHQTKSYPVDFGQITPGSYDGRDWQKRDSVESNLLGYITQYGSSATYEDFVETLSCTITDTDCRWMHAIVNACLNGGVKEGDKVRVYELIDSLEISGLDDPAKNWNNFVIYKESALNEETGKYEETGRYVPSFPNSDHRTDAMSHAETTLKYERVTEFKSFRSFLDNWVEIDTSSEVKGINAILKKLEIATKWYTERWGLHLFEIRREVRKRQVNINDYLRNYVTIYDYQ
jgi:substrate import-associated zinc metallohydrolase lipoprotein